MTDEELKERPKQQYTMEELVEILNKIVYEKMGRARIAKLVIESRHSYHYSYEKIN